MLINFVQVERVTWWTSSSHSCPWNAGTLSSVLRRRWKPGASNQTMIRPGNWQIKSWTTFLGLRESSLSRVARRLPAGWDTSCKQPRDGINTCGSTSVGGSNYRHQTNSISQSAQHIWRHHVFDYMKHTGKVYTVSMDVDGWRSSLVRVVKQNVRWRHKDYLQAIQQ